MFKNDKHKIYILISNYMTKIMRAHHTCSERPYIKKSNAFNKQKLRVLIKQWLVPY